jgi:hypothetical protein
LPALRPQEKGTRTCSATSYPPFLRGWSV